jgi:hypothetical protein
VQNASTIASRVGEIGADGDSLRSDEFRYWLKDARGKYLDELSSENAHKYFRRFVRVSEWQRSLPGTHANDWSAIAPETVRSGRVEVVEVVEVVELVEIVQSWNRSASLTR